MTITISYTKLRSGDWGVRLQGDADDLTEYGEGDEVTVTKRDGNERAEVLDRLVWASDDGTTALYSVERQPARQASRRTPAPPAPAPAPVQAAPQALQATPATVAVVQAACALADDAGSERRLAALLDAVCAWRGEVRAAFAEPPAAPATDVDVETTIDF